MSLSRTTSVPRDAGPPVNRPFALPSCLDIHGHAVTLGPTCPPQLPSLGSSNVRLVSPHTVAKPTDNVMRAPEMHQCTEQRSDATAKETSG